MKGVWLAIVASDSRCHLDDQCGRDGAGDSVHGCAVARTMVGDFPTLFISWRIANPNWAGLVLHAARQFASRDWWQCCVHTAGRE